MLLVTYYCQPHIEKYPASYEKFASPFKQHTNDPRLPLKALDACLNAFYHNSPLLETIPANRVRARPDLKIWARMTVSAISYFRPVFTVQSVSMETETLISHVFCHWQVLVKALIDADHFEDYDQGARTQDLIDVCEILGKTFAVFISDEHNQLGERSKHAVYLYVPG